MEALTQNELGSAWQREPSITEGLSRALRLGLDLLLFTGDPDRGLAELMSAVRLFLGSGGDARRLAAATVLPTREWSAALREAGVSRLFVAPSWSAPTGDGLAAGALREAPRDICPALRTVSIGARSIPVCSMCQGRLVPGEAHLQARCMSQWRECPHRQVVPAAEPMAIA